VRGLIAFTQSREIFREERFWTHPGNGKAPRITWHGVRLGKPDWSYDSHSLAFSLEHPESEDHLHVLLNAYWQPLTFELPPVHHAEGWHLIVDTGLPHPHDFNKIELAPPVDQSLYKIRERSAAVLMIRKL
jgi:isoamylase